MISKKKILYVYHASGIGGGSYCLYNIIEELDKERYLPIVLLRSEGPLSEKLEQSGIKVYYENTISTVPYNRSVVSVSFVRRLIRLLNSISKFKKLLLKLQPDIVYLNTMMMYPYLKVIKGIRKKSIIHLREHWPKNEHICQYKLAKRSIEKYADYIVAINETSASMVNAPEKTLVVHDWIDFTTRDNGVSLSSVFGEDYHTLKIFVFTGGVDKDKGAMEIVETFSSYILDAKARLLMLGVDTNYSFVGYKGRIEKCLRVFKYKSYGNKIRELVLKDDRIVCIPATYSIKQIIEKSYCVLSYFTIPHANLILAESILLGKVVVAANTPEALEYSNNGESALLFKINDKKEFIKKIDELSSNYEYYMEKAKKGSERNKLLFDPLINSSLLNNVYNLLIQ